MKIEKLKLAEIHEDPANVRRHDDRNIDAIKASLLKFGQQKPIVVDKAGLVIAGNGTLRAAISLGWEEIAVVRTDLSKTMATAYGIADNRIAELAAWEFKELSEIVKSLNVEDFDISVLGWSEDELDTLLSADFTKATGKLHEDSEGGPVVCTFGEEDWARVVSAYQIVFPGSDAPEGGACVLAICGQVEKKWHD